MFEPEFHDQLDVGDLVETSAWGNHMGFVVDVGTAALGALIQSTNGKIYRVGYQTIRKLARIKGINK